MSSASTKNSQPDETVTTNNTTTVEVGEQLTKFLDELQDWSDNSPSERLHCIRCRYPITTEENRISVRGEGQFKVSNPMGVNFALGCFGEALGCQVYGEPTTAHTWFNGYTWQFAHCAQCGDHLGWYYKNKDSHYFFGLILDKLASSKSSSKDN